MARKVTTLQLEHLELLGGPVPMCLTWELDAVSRCRLDRAPAALRAQHKQDWVSTVHREWGECGQVVLIDAQPVAVALYAPAAYVPGELDLATAPTSPDAVVLTTVWVQDVRRGRGLGRLLIQAVARDLTLRGIAAAETFGDTRGSTDGCLLPADFLYAVGFKTQRAHPLTPRMRMELRAAATWMSEVEQALERLWGVVRPVRPQAENSSSSLSNAALGLAPTIDLTTSPPL